MRLDKYLSDCGTPRARAREACQRGLVTVDGQVVRDAGHPVADGQVVALCGKPARRQGHALLMLSKPQGVITAGRDARMRTVFDLLPDADKPRDLCAVGRLDRDTTGLLLLTTDGQLAHRLISPRWTIEKVYLATVDGLITGDMIPRMKEGIALSDFTALPADLEIVAPSVGRLTVVEGKYHQVKRMFAALGLTVTRLHRERVGGVALDEGLPPGGFRSLTKEERARLYALTQLTEE